MSVLQKAKKLPKRQFAKIFLIDFNCIVQKRVTRKFFGKQFTLLQVRAIRLGL